VTCFFDFCKTVFSGGGCENHKVGGKFPHSKKKKKKKKTSSFAVHVQGLRHHFIHKHTGFQREWLFIFFLYLYLFLVALSHSGQEHSGQL